MKFLDLLFTINENTFQEGYFYGSFLVIFSPKMKAKMFLEDNYAQNRLPGSDSFQKSVCDNFQKHFSSIFFWKF